MHQHHSFRSLAVTAVALCAATLAMAQTQTQSQSDLHRNAATLNVGGDAFMTKYARAF